MEARLNAEVEEPVHKFLEMAGYKAFFFNHAQILQMTRYITCLFHRSRARKSVAGPNRDLRINALKSLSKHEERISRLAAKYTLDLLEDDPLSMHTVSRQHVLDGLANMIREHSSDSQVQRDYLATIKNMMAHIDESMLRGTWEVVHTIPDDPFVIGDAPVVTWERVDVDVIVHGQGFSKPNVEVLLPVSPVACLHICSYVQRTRRVKTPKVREINEAQAAFATQHCFSNSKSESLNSTLQPRFEEIQLGVNGFVVAGRDYEKMFFEVLMNRGRAEGLPWALETGALSAAR